MQLDEQSASVLLRALDDEPHTPSTVDVTRAIADGRRRRRVRRAAAYGVASAATALVLVGASVAVGAMRAPARHDQTIGTAPATAATTVPPPPSADPVPKDAPAAPAKCVIAQLKVPDGRAQALVTAADPTGRIIAGRSYPNRGTSGDYHVIVWVDRQPKIVDIPGDDQAINDINTAGVAVGLSFVGNGPAAWLYRDGKVSRLPGGDGAEAYAINDANVAVGSRDRRPIVWRSLDQPPIELPLPDGATNGEARDIDEDGTIVGYIEVNNSERPYVWTSSGGRELAPPPGMPADRGDGRGMLRAYGIRNGYVTGIAAVGAAGNSAVRWDLRTGEARVYPQFFIRASMANRLGWQVGTDTQGRGLLVTDTRSVVLPDLVLHKPGELKNIPETVSDDGKVIAGQSDDKNDVIHAVVWTCA